MASKTNISWAHSTLNRWIGCMMVADECANCYAAEMDRKRFSKTLHGGNTQAPVSHWGKGAPRHQTRASQDGTLLKWNRKPWICEGCGTDYPNSNMPCDHCLSRGRERRRVFMGNLMDWADEEVPDSWRDAMFYEAEQATDLTLMFLTKRGVNAHRYLRARYGRTLPKHFWLGASYTQRASGLSWLFEFDVSVRFLSVEPMLGPVKLQGCFGDKVYNYLGSADGVNWVIFGGESGPNARPCNVDWIRDGVWQCRAGGAHPFVKQMGSNAVQVSGCFTSDFGPENEAARSAAVPERIAFKHRAGADPVEWARDLQVQEIPCPAS